MRAVIPVGVRFRRSRDGRMGRASAVVLVVVRRSSSRRVMSGMDGNGGFVMVSEWDFRLIDGGISLARMIGGVTVASQHWRCAMEGQETEGLEIELNSSVGSFRHTSRDASG